MVHLVKHFRPNPMMMLALTSCGRKGSLSRSHNDGVAMPIPDVAAERRRAERAAEEARAIGFRKYAQRWLAMVREQPNRSGKMRAAGTRRPYRQALNGASRRCR